MASPPSLSPTQRGSQIAALKQWFGLDRGQASVLVELVTAAGRPLTRYAIASRCDISLAALRTRLCELRMALDCEAIDALADELFLTPAGLAECHQAFEAMVLDLQAAVSRSLEIAA